MIQDFLVLIFILSMTNILDFFKILNNNIEKRKRKLLQESEKSKFF